MPLPVISVSQMRDWEERTWGEGVDPGAVMKKAGICLSKAILLSTEPGDFILLLAGKGGNGGDTRIASEQLRDRDALLMVVTDPRDAFSKLEQTLQRRPALIVDGLFGIGLNRDLDADWARLITLVNESDSPVLSVDCPSGLEADYGRVYGAAIIAQTTLTFGAPKHGLISDESAKYVGALEVATNIGLSEQLPESDAFWLTESDMHSALPERDPASHKGDYGHLAIISGSIGYHGAAVLSARSALRARPGLVSVFTPSYEAVASHLQSVMVHPWGTECVNALNQSSAILIGPGLAGPNVDDSLKMLARNLWEEFEKPIIVDATALDWIPLNNGASDSPRIITPHPGEAGRLLGMSAEQVQRERVKSSRDLAALYKATVLLKGRHTIITQAQGPVLINSTGNEGLAQGGSGDVLAGYLAGLMAQPAFNNKTIQASAYSVWKHGRCADILDRSNSYWGMNELIQELGHNEFH